MSNETVSVAPIASNVADEATKTAEVALTQARGIVIANVEQYTNAGTELLKVKKFLKDLEVERKKITDPLTKAKEAVMAFFNTPKDNATKAMNIIAGAMQTYDDKKAEEARKENARLSEIARKESEKLSEKARKAEESGNLEKAEELKRQALMKETIVPSVSAEPVKIAGLASRENWTYEITDINLVPREYLCADEKKIGAVIRATKGTLSIPGIKAIKETKIGGSR